MALIENLTIMFTDIVGFSNMVSTLPRAESMRLLKLHDHLLKKVIRRFCGTIIKSVGDSFLVVFRSPTDAVLCGMAMQDALWALNEGKSEAEKIRIRVALNTGEVRLTNRDVFGEAVNIAARLESNTPGGCVYLTESVYLTMNRNEVEFSSIGEQSFKGIPQPIKIYEAARSQSADIDNDYAHYPYRGAHQHLKPANRKTRNIGKLSIGIVASLLAGFFSWWATVTYMPGPDVIELDKAVVEYRQPDSITEDSVVMFATDINAELRSLAEPLVANNNYLQLSELTKTYRMEYPTNPYLRSLQGHVAMYNRNYEAAIADYKFALDNNPALARDELLARNLVELLDHQRLPANRLIARYLSQPLLAALSKRSGEEGLRGRYDAFYLLRDSGNADKVDTVGLNIWDLRELDDCSLKKVAVKELKRLNDPRALPALKEAVDVGLLDTLKYMCYRRDATAAIEQMEAKVSGNKS